MLYSYERGIFNKKKYLFNSTYVEKKNFPLEAPLLLGMLATISSAKFHIMGLMDSILGDINI